MRRAKKATVFAAFCLFVAGCATAPLQDLKPGERPALETDEAGFWMVTDRIEAKLSTSGRIVKDPKINAYVRGIICRLTPEHCANIRLYVVRTPNFNASMMPNGAMQVWTGAILRSRNEAQLAYVIGHELSHYLRRHTIQQWRDARAKTDALAFFQLATALAGVPVVGMVVQIATMAGHFGFTRDQERESDRLGFEMMVQAGYDPREAAKVWEALLEEKDASDEPKKLIFFSTHPASEEREKTLAKMAEELGDNGGLVGKDKLAAVTSIYRGKWLRDELRHRDYPRLEVVIKQQIESWGQQGTLHYFQGELYRLRGEEEDAAKAVAAYQEALSTNDPPAQTHRALGLVYWSMDRPAEARAAFENYLLADPAADDRPMIESYIQQIKGGVS
ncbi:MAG: M48 family metalloprotease [Kiloniellales bacterium]